MTVAFEIESRLPSGASKCVLPSKEPDSFLSTPWQSRDPSARDSGTAVFHCITDLD